jgi:phytoene synthase
VARGIAPPGRGHPSATLQPHLDALPQAEMAEMLAGTEMDLAQSRYLDEIGLLRYCRASGGTFNS